MCKPSSVDTTTTLAVVDLGGPTSASRRRRIFQPLLTCRRVSADEAVLGHRCVARCCCRSHHLHYWYRDPGASDIRSWVMITLVGQPDRRPPFVKVISGRTVGGRSSHASLQDRMPAPLGPDLGIGSMSDHRRRAVMGQGRGKAPARSAAQRSLGAALDASEGTVEGAPTQ